MANLKLVQQHNGEENVESCPQTVIFNPISGVSPREVEQKNTLFVSESPSIQSHSELTAGTEFLIFTKA